MSLFNKKNSVPASNSQESFLAEGIKIEGDIKTFGSMRIDGQIKGTLRADGDIYLGEKSKITGDIFGAHIIVSGEVHGNVSANNGLEITHLGRVHGDVTGDRLVIDEGALFKGKVNMEQNNFHAAEKLLKVVNK